MTELAPDLRQPLLDLLLAVADDKLILGHRNSDWTGLAPVLEEDIAFSSLAQDEMAHARALYELAAPLAGGAADQLAFGRRPEQYRCCALVELPDHFDWATAIGRQLLCDHFDLLRLERLSRSSYEPLAALARRLHAEERIHVEHADGWITRLGTGTEESHRRIQEALDALSPYGASLLEMVQGQQRLEEAGLYPTAGDDMLLMWTGALTKVTERAGLSLALQQPAADAVGGRRGRHTEHLEELLDEMTEVFRLEPDAAW